LWLDIAPAAVKAYAAELRQKQTAQQAVIKQLEKRLGNKNYIQNAPPQVIKQSKDQLTEATLLLTDLEQEIQRFTA
jgi:valyl-tRNA synthetase